MSDNSNDQFMEVDGDMPLPAMGRRGAGGSLPGVPVDEWLNARGAASTDGMQVTSPLDHTTKQTLVVEAARCVRGITKLHSILSNPDTMQKICKRTNSPMETVEKLIKGRRDELSLRRDRYMAVVDAPNGLTLTITIDDASFTFA